MSKITVFTDRRAMYGILPAYSVGAELGVLTGDNARSLLSICRPRKLFLVDDFSNGDSSLEVILDKFNRDDRVSIVTSDDVDWLRSVKDKSLDWCYIDTSHQYDHTVNELAVACKKVRGMILGHDWCCTGIHDDIRSREWRGGVMRAVIEFVNCGKLEMIGITEASSCGDFSDRFPSWACVVK